MNRDSAILYANKVLNKLEAVKIRASGTKSIHDVDCQIAILVGYIKFMDTVTPKMTDEMKLENLREAIRDTEGFLVRTLGGK